MSIHSLIKKYNIHPKKSLGQNFLIDINVLEKIVKHLTPLPTDKVLEIGPGIGVMTRLLTEQVKFVAAVDPDKEMIRILESEIGSEPNLHIIQGDILDTNLEKLLKGPLTKHTNEDKWLFIGNIPYNITSPILFHLRSFRQLFKHGVLTIQKEVAERLVAKPSTKDYGILTIAMQAVGSVEKCFHISPSSFYPEPRVDSAVIRITFDEKPKYGIEDLDFFTKVVRAAFSTRRKKIKNAILQSKLINISSEQLEEALKKTGIKDNSRAEELEIETFALLSKNISSL